MRAYCNKRHEVSFYSFLYPKGDKRRISPPPFYSESKHKLFSIIVVCTSLRPHLVTFIKINIITCNLKAAKRYFDSKDPYKKL